MTGVAGSEGGLGYFGFSYYEQNQDKLNVVGVGESADSCVKPSAETIQDGSYTPLSRPLFMYPSDQALERRRSRRSWTSCSRTSRRSPRRRRSCR